ncbi:hypothetical protein ATKI12_4380 [Kitasatospora sp. Ki12]
MASVVGVLEERELAARERVEELREVADRVLAEVAEAETAWHEWLIARQRVGEVLSGPRPGQAGEAGPGAGESSGSEPATNAPAEVPLPRAARSGSIVPVWRPALSMDALAPHYQRILATLTEQASGGKPVMSCQETAGGLYDAIPAGEFQPSTVMGDPAGLDFDLWRNIVRELNEEPHRDLLLGS